jgi:hypothetical protein
MIGERKRACKEDRVVVVVVDTAVEMLRKRVERYHISTFLLG